MTAVSRDLSREHAAKDRVRDAFAAWASGTGGPFGLLAEDATWTIVGNSPVSRTYATKADFISTVIEPFNARMSAPLVPTVRHLFADEDWVIVLFDAHATAHDGQPYQNTYTWYLRFDPDRDDAAPIVEVIAFFDTIEFTDFWERVRPA
ncbi:MAG TPA: nuclear transport factor 2 family protein [Actinomycetospora sp.]|nr:nuclear transport factor 2 family protein [Actinomycetospora sp.]